MQLSYRGTAYQPQAPAIEASESQHTGIFLGQVFVMKHFNVAGRQAAPVQLKYRGSQYQQ